MKHPVSFSFKDISPQFRLPETLIFTIKEMTSHCRLSKT